MKYAFILRSLLGLALFLVLASDADAQRRRSTRRSTNRSSTANVQPAQPTTVAAPAEVKKDSLPVSKILQSKRLDAAVNEVSPLRDRTPLAYEHLRADDVVFRHRIWREIDAREKINLPFLNPADADNGNQRFISILMQALADSTKGITAFSNLDDRFTTPLTMDEIAKKLLGEEIDVQITDSLGQVKTEKKRPEVNLDSFYRFRIKEEVVFDRESSRLFWRILGIAPVKDVIVQSTGVKLGVEEIFWIYYPDLRPIFSTYQVYNGKNFGVGMSWEELFENRMFSGRIYKYSGDNARNMRLEDIPGLRNNTMLQLYQGDEIKNKIHNAEQNVWSY
jgi:gliding motility associated protien GldN